ncbi:hypothetical protein HK102_011373, partial [Quaeritorhiza haematococci]
MPANWIKLCQRSVALDEKLTASDAKIADAQRHLDTLFTVSDNVRNELVTWRQWPDTKQGLERYISEMETDVHATEAEKRAADEQIVILGTVISDTNQRHRSRVAEENLRRQLEVVSERSQVVRAQLVILRTERESILREMEEVRQALVRSVSGGADSDNDDQGLEILALEILRIESGIGGIRGSGIGSGIGISGSGGGGIGAGIGSGSGGGGIGSGVPLSAARSPARLLAFFPFMMPSPSHYDNFRTLSDSCYKCICDHGTAIKSLKKFITEATERNVGRMGRIASERREIEEQKEEIDKEISEVASKKSQVTSTLQELQQKLADLRQKLGDLEDLQKISEVATNISEVASTMQELQQEFADLEEKH